MLPTYSQKFTFVLSQGTIVAEALTNTFSNHNDETITTTEPLTSESITTGQGLVVYYEVKIKKAGKYENIVIGLSGPEIYYHGMNGRITLGNKIIGKAPRFGSFDTIGIGILRNSKVFVTYNGLLYNYFYGCDPHQEIKIFIGLYGEGCEVEIFLKNFLFLSAKETIEFSTNSETNKIFQKIFKTLTNFLENKKDSKALEIINKLKDLLKDMKKEDLIKKLRLK